jgi:hypothetical protein
MYDCCYIQQTCAASLTPQGKSSVPHADAITQRVDERTTALMQDVEPAPITREIEIHRRSDKVESPQQYSNWRDYAFSEAPEEDSNSLR